MTRWVFSKIFRSPGNLEKHVFTTSVVVKFLSAIRVNDITKKPFSISVLPEDHLTWSQWFSGIEGKGGNQTILRVKNGDWVHGQLQGTVQSSALCTKGLHARILNLKERGSIVVEKQSAQPGRSIKYQQHLLKQKNLQDWGSRRNIRARQRFLKKKKKKVSLNPLSGC